jgi:hypothetical protein
MRMLNTSILNISLIAIIGILSACKPDLTQKSAARLIPDGMSISNVYKMLGPDAVVSKGNDGMIYLIYFFPFFPPPPRVNSKIGSMTVIISNNVVVGRSFNDPNSSK